MDHELQDTCTDELKAACTSHAGVLDLMPCNCWLFHFSSLINPDIINNYVMLQLYGQGKNPGELPTLRWLYDSLAPCETTSEFWLKSTIKSGEAHLCFVVPLNLFKDARLPSGAGSREGGAGLPSLQATAAKCSTNWRWCAPLSDLFQGDCWVSLAADFDWIGYACLCNCSRSASSS